MMAPAGTQVKEDAAGAAVEVRERPILFSGEMVRAILEGRKTQTRRVVEPQAMFEGKDGILARYPHQSGSPYGEKGGRLWVREAHAIEGGERVVYRADRAARYFHDHPFGGMGPVGETFYLDSDYEPSRPDHWRPSIHMPRWASRLTLEIVDVRVERVQDISQEDAWAEGVPCRLPGAYGPTTPTKALPTAREDFRTLWDSLNGPRGYGWDANPWVWALTFRRVEAA